jgi:hypothetical protein
MSTTTVQESKNQAHGISNIIINVIIPVVILNKLSSHLGPVYALALALAFPLCYGLYDLVVKKRTNYFSILGLINVSLTGSLALMHLDGMWFAAKEAIFPSLIGAFVFASSYGKSPFIETLILNPQLMRIDLIHEKLEEKGEWQKFEFYMRRSTQLLAMTFLVSAVVNFSLAIRIFIPLDMALDQTARSTLLNEQIAHMTMWASAVILVPSIVMLSGILWYLIKGIRLATGLTTEQILKS